MNTQKEQWRQIADVICEMLPEIDSVLSAENIPISVRKLRAFDILRSTAFEISDHEAFLVSEAHGRIQIIIDEWFRERYGDDVTSDGATFFDAAVEIHGTHFLMQVPKLFRSAAETKGMVWIGFPCSVQPEEDPLSWLKNAKVAAGLTEEQRGATRSKAAETAGLIRSINFDISLLKSGQEEEVRKLANAIISDVQSAARHLCSFAPSAAQSTGWDISQATEKALKLLIVRGEKIPPKTHDLSALADLLQGDSGMSVDRISLNEIPSRSDATGLRYGAELSLSDASSAYFSGLRIIQDVLSKASPHQNFNFREARFKIKRPPWFEFDMDSFVSDLRSREAEG